MLFSNSLADTKSSALPAKVDSIFGAWTDRDSEAATLAIETTYQATSDGFITYFSAPATNGGRGIYTGSVEADVTNEVSSVMRVGLSISTEYGYMCPVRKNDYVRVTALDAGTVQWLPNHRIWDSCQWFANCA